MLTVRTGKIVSWWENGLRNRWSLVWHVGIVHGVAEGGILLEPFQFDCLRLLGIRNYDTKRCVNSIENTAKFVCECCGLRTPVNVISTYRPDTRSSLKLTSQRRLVG